MLYLHSTYCTFYSVQVQQRTLYISWTVPCKCTAENTIHIMNCTLYSVQIQQISLWISWTLQFIMYMYRYSKEHCTYFELYSVQCIVYSVQMRTLYILWSVQCTVYSYSKEHYTYFELYIVQCTCKAEDTLHIMNCTVYSI